MEARQSSSRQPISREIDSTKLQAFVDKMLGDVGAAMTGSLVMIGDELGLYRAMAEAGPVNPYELAQLTATNARMVQEWLAAQAAAGYVNFDPVAGTYTLDPEQAMIFADEDGPAFLASAYDIVAAGYRDEPRVREAFKTGRGLGWHEHHTCLFRGTERFFKTGYKAHLVSEWLPSLDGVVARLEAGARVADVGCGHGASTLIMAQAFPKSQFFGFDYHMPSILAAREAAADAGLADRVHFERATAKDFTGGPYDLVCFFDCLHDMGDPAGAAAHVKEELKRDGVWMVVEPQAADSVADNLNPVGRIFYAASTMICTPASMSQDVGLALGAQAGRKRLGDVMREGGFNHVKVAVDTPFNMVFDARL
ncbi:class I SAM-dependent methyltransferase [Chelatococcus asaccharovorans]|uniref:Methyltransferase family protein n=1 Tax=Chelatococcus asaccharovorans TaxID=28210 RepID=A0A2V3UEI3_9HYPH|nr:class I SAM-dependent methyltransferase [Chelatococcus asaccharovorans]MBS7702766.1 methyltransferase domain-containing protein [Chelatococcus asaccharovorans]PXW57060.1 methyltransferase family protein [Chelatococcus asaccharovorans]